MIRYLVVLFSMFLFTGVTNFRVLAEENPFDPKMLSEKGCIDYTVKGGSLLGSGFEKFCWRGDGAEMVTITKTKGEVMGEPISINTKVITTSKWVTTIDYDANTAKKITSPAAYMKDQYSKLHPKEKENFRKHVEEVGSNMSVMIGAWIDRKAGEMHGYKYDVLHVMMTKTWVASDYPLVVLRREMFGSVTEVKKIDMDVSPPASLFKVDKNIKVTHDPATEGMSEMFSKGFVTSMADPNGFIKIKEDMANAKAITMRDEAERNRNTQPRSADAFPEDANMSVEDEIPGDGPASTNAKPADEKERAEEEMERQLKKGFNILKGFFK